MGNSSFLFAGFRDGIFTSWLSRGPFHHSGFEIISPQVNPRVNKSTGFSSLGQYIQYSGSHVDCISATRFATTGFQQELSPQIQWSATMLSVQQTTLSILTGKVSATYLNNLALTTAARSSSLGSDTVFLRPIKISATLDLDITGCDHTWPCLSIIRMALRLRTPSGKHLWNRVVRSYSQGWQHFQRNGEWSRLSTATNLISMMTTSLWCHCPMGHSTVVPSATALEK